jgi:outer membrane cobalamin receptor
MKNTSIIAVAVIMISGIGSVVSAQEKNVTLNEIVVTATKTEKELKDVTQSVTIVTSAELRNSGATNAAEALRSVTGVFLTDQGTPGALATLSIRGSSYSQVLVLLDGVRMNSPRDAGADLSALPVALDDIERIEIVRGPSSALYGSDAVGGVVNIITKKPTGTVSRISAAAGSHGYDTLQLNTAGRMGSGYYSMTGSRETSDGFRVNGDLEQWIVNGRAGYDISKQTSVDLTANYISKEDGAPGSLQYPSPFARQRDRDMVLGASFRTRLSKDLDIKISGSRSDDLLRYQDPFPSFGPPPINSQHASVSKVGEVQVNWFAGSWNLFSLGYEQRKDSLVSTDSGNHETTNDAWFLQDELSLGDSLIVVLGGREDKHSVYGDNFSPRASARYLVRGSGTIIRVSYGKSFRAPTFNDLYWSDPFSMGNPNLKPESAKEYEAGIEQPFGTGNRIKLTGFERKVTDLINWNFMVFPMTPENIGKADIKGLEAEAAFRLSNVMSLGANYTYIKAIDDITGDKIYSTLYPKNQIKGHLDIALDTDVHLFTEARMVENYVPAGSPAWRYTVVDAKLAQKFGRRADAKGEIYFAVTNIFDRKYEVVQGYPMPPKEIRGGITIPF